jgi:hypothetical protein
MHKADRGGFIFSPEPGLYEDVYEVEVASLYPNIMITRRIRPGNKGLFMLFEQRGPGAGLLDL